MAVTTITIDMDAYGLLAAAKRGKESFSKVIKRRLAPQRTADNLLQHLGEIALAPETLERLEEVVASRRTSLAQSPTLD